MDLYLPVSYLIFYVPLILMAFIVLVLVIYNIFLLRIKFRASRIGRINNLINSIGLFTLIYGILGQLIGLYLALDAIGDSAGISPEIWMAGFKNSMETTIFGLFVFAVAKGSTMIFSFSLNKTSQIKG